MEFLPRKFRKVFRKVNVVAVVAAGIPADFNSRKIFCKAGINLVLLVARAEAESERRFFRGTFFDKKGKRVLQCGIFRNRKRKSEAVPAAVPVVTPEQKSVLNIKLNSVFALKKKNTCRRAVASQKFFRADILSKPLKVRKIHAIKIIIKTEVCNRFLYSESFLKNIKKTAMQNYAKLFN